MFNPISLDAHNPGPMTGAGNRTYLIAGTSGTSTLVDAGVGEARHLDAIANATLAAHATLTHVLVTHGHADHASGAPALAAAHPGARFYKHPWPEADARYDVPWESLADGDRVVAGDTELVVLKTPGHAPDHLAFWHEPTRTAFTGDLVVLGSSVLIHFSGGGDLGQYLASLERLRALRPARLLPAHGPEITDPDTMLKYAIAHRLERERQVAKALRAGHATVLDIAESIYDGLAPALMPAARENVRAHLEKLRHEGQAVEEDGRWRA